VKSSAQATARGATETRFACGRVSTTTLAATSTTAGPTRRAASGRRFRVTRFQRFREEGLYLLPVGRQVEWRGRYVPHYEARVGPDRLNSFLRSDASRNIPISSSVPHEASAGAAALSHKHRQHARTASLVRPFRAGRAHVPHATAIECRAFQSRGQLKASAPRLHAVAEARAANHQETVLQRCRKS
jgi:hypothetical protein